MLKTSKIIREKLFLNQYKYRVKIRLEALRFFYPYMINANSLKSVDARYSELMSPAEIITIKNLILFKKNYSNILGTTIRKDHCCFTVFTNSNETVQEAIDSVEDSILGLSNKASIDVTEIADLIPEGIKYFKRTPKSKKRVYLKEQYVPGRELADELTDLFARSPNLKPSKSLMEDISEKSKWQRTWIQTHHYFDCDTDADISYFMLVFPELVKKIYKLEKKPDDTMIE